MATLVTFHAHPDDESIGSGGVMRKAADEGHRVVLVIGTRGEQGEVADGFLAPDEQLWERRVVETQSAAKILGVQRLEFLGYRDSGMMGDPANDLPGSFWTADVEEAAQRLAALLIEENADVLTIYDDNGGYGHPDHIQVHRVGKRAAQIAGTARVYQGTMNREYMKRGMEAFAAQAKEAGMQMPSPDDIGNSFGKPEAEITVKVDVTAFTHVKRAAMRAHASQISEDSFFLAMPAHAFEYSFGFEWFIHEGHGPGITETDLMAGLD